MVQSSTLPSAALDEGKNAISYPQRAAVSRRVFSYSGVRKSMMTPIFSLMP